MKVVPRITLVLVIPAMISSQPSPFCAESTAPLRNLPATGAQRFLGLRGFAAHDAQIAIRKFRGVGRRVNFAFQFVQAADAYRIFIERARVFRAADEGMHFGDAGQMRGVETSD